MIKEFFFLCFFTTTLLSTTGCQKVQDLPDAVSFTNPLLPSGPDPWVVQQDSMYYYTSTDVSAITIRKTTSVSRLRNAAPTLVWTPKLNAANTFNIWAPELHFINNKWYLYYTAGASPTDFSTQRIFVLENKSPDPTAGNWMDKGKLADTLQDYFSLDATILKTDTANYMIWSSVAAPGSDRQCLYIAKMLNPWTLSGRRVMIAAPTYNWEKVGLPATSGINEGPEVLSGPTGKLFIVFSASGCWTDNYALGLLMLKPGGDPMIAQNWSKKEMPVFTTLGVSGAFGPGHNSFFKSPDGKEDWIMYHANPAPNDECLGKRSPRMQKFNWNPDGTPNFGQPVPVNVKALRPSGERD